MITGFFKVLWLVLAVACVVWYSTVTIYVAIKGASDIRHMLERLRRENSGASEG